MSDLTVVVDDKARTSTMCRRGEHVICQQSGAFCSCTCHGKGGSEPPKRETPRPVVAPAAPVAEFECGVCGRVFGRPQALGRHRTAAHSAAAKEKAAPKPDPNTHRKQVVEVEAPPVLEGWLVVVLGTPDAQVAVVSSEFDADQVTAMLCRLGHQAVRFDLADAF